MLFNSIIQIISALGTLGAAICAVVALHQTRAIQQDMINRDCINHTIEAIDRLQNQVLDELNSYTDKRVLETSKDARTIEYKRLAGLMARCEHFSVGVLSEVYDIDLVCKLTGEYLYYQYRKLKPMIDKKRRMKSQRLPYEHFEKLAVMLHTMNNENIGD